MPIAGARCQSEPVSGGEGAMAPGGRPAPLLSLILLAAVSVCSSREMLRSDTAQMFPGSPTRKDQVTPTTGVSAPWDAAEADNFEHL